MARHSYRPPVVRLALMAQERWQIAVRKRAAVTDEYHALTLFLSFNLSHASSICSDSSGRSAWIM